MAHELNIMTIIIICFGIAVALLGLIGIIMPERFRKLLGAWRSQPRFLFAVIVRLAFGSLLLAAAAELRFPLAMKILGGVSILAAFVLLLLGRDRLDRLVAWWLRLPDEFLRVSTLFVIIFGVFLIYVAS